MDSNSSNITYIYVGKPKHNGMTLTDTVNFLDATKVEYSDARLTKPHPLVRTVMYRKFTK